MSGPFRFPTRPGGLTITQKALSICAFPPQARLIDIGCGQGSTVRHLQKNSPYQVCGVDLLTLGISSNSPIIRASSASLPFPDNCFDGALMECSLSAMDDQHRALQEVQRLLKPTGILILSDVYARGIPARLNGCLTRLDREETLHVLLQDHGFILDLSDDQSDLLRQQWAQMVFDYGLALFCSDLGTDPCTLSKIRCGYMLVIAHKAGDTL